MNNFFLLDLLHVFNDGFESSVSLLLPFIAKGLHINLTHIGLLGSMMKIFDVLLALPSAYIAARFGGMKIILFALFVYAIGYTIIGIAPSFTFLLFCFAITGIGFALFHPIAFGMLAGLAEKTKRGKIMGNFTAIGDLGRIGFAAFITFIIGFIGWRFASLSYAAAAFLLFLAYQLFCKKYGGKFTVSRRTKKNVHVLSILFHKKFLLASIANVLDSFASYSLFIFLPFLLLKRGIPVTWLSIFTAAYFFGNFSGKALLGRFVDTFGNVRMFILSECCMAIFIFVLANVNNVFIAVIASTILGVFTKGTLPIINTMVTEATEHHGNFEKAFGISTTMATIAIAVSPITLGFISDKWGVVSAFNTCALFALSATIPALFYKISK